MTDKAMNDKQKIDLWRNLFYGNQTQFARRIVYMDEKSGKQVRRYHPVMQHSDRGGDPQYEPLTDSWISKHIHGQEELMMYILHPGLTIRFAAVDFDREHNFEDVKRVYNLLTGLGIKCHIARSTQKGYHLYMFFTEQFRSFYIIAIFEWLMDKAGFREEAQYNKRMMPETFPRNVGAPNLGHGIKPPLWSAGFPDHNVFVDIDDVPFEDQWKHAQSIGDTGRNETKNFLDMVENHSEMELRQGDETFSKATARKLREKQKYVPPTSGDFNRIIARCPAANKIWNKPVKMQSHEERVAVLALAKGTANGINIIRERYGHSDEVERQIDYAIETNQLPWTCQAMITHGFCDKRTPCLKKLPPAERIDGRIVVNPGNIPEDQWPEPSCIRYAFDSDLDAAVLKDEILKLKAYTGDDRESVIENVIRNLIKLDAKKRIELEDLLAEAKLFKNRTSLKKYIQQIEIAVNKEANKQLTIVNYGEVELGFDQRGYVSYMTAKNGEKIPNQLTNFKVFIEQDISVLGIFENNRTFTGYIEVREPDDINHIIKYPFSMEVKIFYSNLLIQEIAKVAGSVISARTSTRDVDAIRHAIVSFGRQNVLKIIKYEEYGMRMNGENKPFKFMGGDFLCVDKDAITRDTNNYVDLSSHEVARGLKLRMITEGQFRDLANHIVKDVLTCHEPHVIYTTFAHSMQATIHEAFIPTPDKTTVWVQGLTGSGKTFAAEIAAAFHGDGRSIILNARTTTKSMESYGAVFKDSLLVIDDYKNNMAELGMKTFIQNVYDSKSRGRLKQNGKQNNAPRVRALVMVTAEDILGAESSTMARLILIRTKSTSHLTEEDRIREKTIRENMPLYPGFTAYFIKYMLNHTKEHVAQNYERVREELAKKMGDTNNGNRICNNLAANYITFSYLCDFLLMYRVISKETSLEMKKTHWRNVQVLANQMAAICIQEQASNVFVNALRELLSSGRYYIEGVTTGLNNAERIGFAEKNDKGKVTVVYLHPAQAVRAVKALQSEGERISHTRDAIGQQLVQAGIIIQSYEGTTMVRKTFQGQHPYVWACDPIKLGLYCDAIATPPVDLVDPPMDPVDEQLMAAEKERMSS